VETTRARGASRGRTVEDPGVLAWLREFAAAVRAADYDGARRLFHRGVVGFGTVAARVEGLDRLVLAQWRSTWGVTRGFDFAWDDARGGVEGDHAWVAAPWSSTGFDPGGRPFERRGRATIVLRRRPRSPWRAVHTHFSLDPVPPGA
jgi:ketosteroid isomerase-like protein